MTTPTHSTLADFRATDLLSINGSLIRGARMADEDRDQVQVTDQNGCEWEMHPDTPLPQVGTAVSLTAIALARGIRRPLYVVLEAYANQEAFEKRRVEAAKGKAPVWDTTLDGLSDPNLTPDLPESRLQAPHPDTLDGYRCSRRDRFLTLDGHPVDVMKTSDPTSLEVVTNGRSYLARPDTPIPSVGLIFSMSLRPRGGEDDECVTLLARMHTSPAAWRAWKQGTGTSAAPLSNLLVEPGMTVAQTLTPNGKVNPDPTPSPPLGLIPEHIRTQLNGKARVREISEALHRYAEAGKPAPQLWTQELLRLLAKE